MPAGNLKHEEAIAMARMLKNLFGASSTIPDSNDFFRSIRYNDLYDVYNEEAEEEFQLVFHRTKSLNHSQRLYIQALLTQLSWRDH